MPLFDQTHPGTQIVDAIDQQATRSIGEVYREKIRSAGYVRSSVAHLKILMQSVGVRKLTPTYALPPYAGYGP